MNTVISGLDRIAAEHPPWWNEPIGLLANQASVTIDHRYAWDLWRDSGTLRSLFCPQHGLWSEQQANMRETYHLVHPELDIPIFSLYYKHRRPLPEMLESVSRLVIDLQDVGTRVYTFAWTMMYCLEACADLDIPVTILDRPNPVGGKRIEGPLLDPEYASFVGRSAIPMRHGLTMGELGRFLARQHRIDVELDVVPVSGWDPASYAWQWQRPDLWIPPSPNIPSAATALYYAGSVLLEGTNLSEGRGTTRPFELIGAPFVDPNQLIPVLASFDLPGVTFIPVRFRPTFDKWTGVVCSGVQLRVSAPDAFQPYATTVALLAAIKLLWPAAFGWSSPPYEYEFQRLPIEILCGGSSTHEAIDAGTIDSPDALRAEVSLDEVAWWDAVDASLLYPRE